jgi:DNA repair protein RadD
VIALRPYQTDLVERIRIEFRQHRRVLAVAPTGSGKTVTFAYITSSAAAKGKRVFVAAHRAEIVEQISGAIDQMGVRHGRVQPGHSMTSDPVQVAMVQTLARRLDRIVPPDLLVVDEAHHGVAGTWQSVCAAWPTARILGVTATPQRLDGRGLGEAFDTMVVGPSMADLIGQGFLAKYRYLAPPQQADLSAIRTKMGDFAIDELAAAMDKSVITGDAVQHYIEHLGGRPAIAFCVTVAHAEHVAEQFRSAGIRAASVDGKMDRVTRRDMIAAIGDGRLQVLTSCELISEGVDVPVVAGAILLRPTKSLGMGLQQIGRALRLKPDGSDAVILDHVGNVNRHGLPDAPRVWSLDAKKKRAGDPTESIAQCETCFRVFAAPPGWRKSAECPSGEPPVGCIITSAAEPKALPDHVGGKLELVTDSPEWARGINIMLARGQEFNDLIAMADTSARLKQIAKMRGYHHRWATHILAAREQVAA